MAPPEAAAEVLEGWIRDALSHIGDVAHLEANPLTALLVRARGHHRGAGPA